MRTLGLLKKLLLVGSAFFLSVGAMAQNGLILVSGTDFSCEGKESEAFTDVTAITGYLGIIKPSISMNLPVAETTEFDTKSSDFVDGNFYAITNNPTKLDSFRLYDNKEAQWGLMLPRSKGTATVMSFQVNGLSAGSPYRVEVDYCFVADYDIDKKCGYPGVTYNTGSKKVEFGGIDPKIRFVVNPDQYNVTSGPDVGFTTAQKTSGGCATQTVTAATSNCGVVSSTGELKLNINATQQTSAIFITGIRVYATVTPKVSGSETVCAGGENGLLSVGAAYVGATYQWYKDDKLLTGETGQKLIHTSDLTNAGSYKYHYVMTVPDGKGGTVDIESEKWTVEDVVCCQDDNGNPQSRKLIYKNDFGTFTSDKGNEFYIWDYTDLSEPKKKYYKTTTPFISNLPAIGIEAPEGALNTDIMSADAHAIVAFISDADGAKIGWAAQCDNGGYWGPGRENGPFFPDHTDQYEGTGKYGAALFVNAAKGNHTQNPIRIYKQEIEGICEQTHLTVKCFINNFSNGTTPIRVRIKAYDSQHPNDPQYGGESPIIERDATGKDQGWKEVSVDIPRIESRSLTFEILDYSENSNDQGDDLILDDIMVYACSSPSVDLYFDLSAHSKEEETCDGVGLKLMVDETVMLKNFYDPDLAYLYQYNIKDPDDADFKKSWINLNTTLASNPAEPIYEQLEAIIEQIKEKADGTDYPKVYFRVVAGIKDIIQNTINKDNYFNPDDPCSNMSISKPIELTIDCPSCSEPADPVISAEGGMVNKAKKTVELCKGESTVLTTNDITGVDKNGDPYADYTITWHKETATSAALGKASPAVVAPELTVAWDDVTEDGVMYIVKVHDIFENEKGTTGCDKLDTIVVIANPVPEKTLAEVEPFCEGTLAANEAPTLTIDGYKLHWYEDADTTKATKEPSVIDKEAKEYEYFYVLEDSKTGCKGEVNLFSFTVNPIPEAVKGKDTIDDIRSSGSLSIEDKAKENGVVATGTNTIFWSESPENDGVGVKKAPMVDVSKEDKAGKEFYYFQKNEETGCYSEKSKIVVVVNDSPKPSVKDTVVCVGKTIADLSSLVKKESKDYELLWYASASDAKEDGVTTPASLTEE
ncbi:MAG: hypothetical protein J6Q59_08750, partial [Paludibacteraceae bacterium]|nr:hypothetical protein [Paludibacteraceae bacterium]